MENQNLFANKTLSQQYALHRPSYPEAVFNRIIGYCSETSDKELALDVACGSGQSTKPLTKWYKEVIGIDTSKTMVCIW